MPRAETNICTLVSRASGTLEMLLELQNDLQMKAHESKNIVVQIRLVSFSFVVVNRHNTKSPATHSISTVLHGYRHDLF